LPIDASNSIAASTSPTGRTADAIPAIVRANGYAAAYSGRSEIFALEKERRYLVHR